MAHYVGFVSIPHGSYQEWRDATLGNGYDIDGWWGEQCWDYCAIFYRQYNLTLYTGDGTAAGCWLLMRGMNAVMPFVEVTRVQDIKRGDILVFARTPFNYAGHISFADADYNQSYIDYRGIRRLPCLGQNQEGNGSGSPASVNDLNIGEFIGGFRNTYWEGSSPQPPPESGYNRNRYNFVLFNRRKRQEKWTRKPLKRRYRN